MPALTNPKHERFAQELAKGETAREAYVTAGYARSDAHASRLASSGKVQARISEILERSAKRAEISIATLTADLMRIAQKAEANNDPSGFSVARAAIMDAAKLNGLVVDRSVNVNTNRNQMSDDELEDIATGRGSGASEAPPRSPLAN